ncbi:MAG: DNA methyltransferase, partial [bacterium]
GYTEMGKDGTKMGVGSPEYVVLFRKPQTDRSKGYADVPVCKTFPQCVGEDGKPMPFKRGAEIIPGTGYSIASWQVDAHAFWRSSGDRQITAEELAGLGPDKLASLFTKYSLQQVYDYEFHVRIGEELAARGALPSTFMSLAPGSHHPDVWHDVARMFTLNSDQSRRAVEKHVCPLQFDIVDRLIERYSNAGELVYDPFCGLGTVPYRAILKGRRGGGSELNPGYFMDQVHYLRAAEKQVSMPSLFDLDEADAAQPEKAAA